MAPFLLLGFFLAGVIKVLIPVRWFSAALGRRNLRSVLTASIVGIPLPLCSCSVLPTAVALRRGGASKGATASFLVATPETGVDSISLTYALLDPIMTLARP
ncbi:MAG: permease, partial [Candidatus Eisenbacteria bacterium]|nr:permease [Candidatus Eisenbacteria bacterium]